MIENKPKYVFIDFIDERFDLVRLPDGTLLSYSFELKASHFVQNNYPEATIIQKASTEGLALWERGLDSFLASIRIASPETKFILHKAWFQTEIAAAEGNIPWSVGVNIPTRTLNTSDCNDLMKELYARAEAIGIDFVVEADDQFQISAAEHRWGRHQVHYVPDYYRACWQQIAAILSPSQRPPADWAL